MGKTKPASSQADIILQNGENIIKQRGLRKQPSSNVQKENQPADAAARHRHQTVRQSARQRKANRRLLSDEVNAYCWLHLALKTYSFGITTSKPWYRLICILKVEMQVTAGMQVRYITYHNSCYFFCSILHFTLNINYIPVIQAIMYPERNRQFYPQTDGGDLDEPTLTCCDWLAR